MNTVTAEGKELRYWDFAAERKDESGAVLGLGDWVKKPTQVSYVTEGSVDEVIESLQRDEKEILAIIAAGREAIAKAKAGAVPEGTFSKAMVSAACRALKASPQFRGLKSSTLRDAVMKYISANEGIKQGFLLAFADLRNAEADEDEE